MTNAYFDQETSFRDLYHFKFLINDAPDRVTKLIDALIPRYNQRKRKINDCCQSDAGSMFSFATATNSGFSSPFVARKPLRDLNLSQPNVIEDDEAELSQENNLQPIVNPTTPPQKLR